MLVKLGRSALVLSAAALLLALNATPAVAQPTAVSPVAGARWVTTGDLNIARADHTATLLPDGRVLVAGGHSIDNDPSSISAGDDLIEDTAELYDPSTGRWTLTGRMNHPRLGHTATLLTDGRVLVSGGTQSFDPAPGPYGNTAEIYDPATGRWTSTSPMTGSRAFHTATRLSNGKVLVAGGHRADAITDCELFDPATGTWSPTGSLMEGHDSAPATLLPNGKVLIVGGLSGFETISDTVEIYDPATGTWAWEYAAAMPVARFSYTATLLRDGRVLMVGGARGGKTSIVYDSTSNEWSSLSWRPAALAFNTATLLPDGSVLIAGGAGDDGRQTNAAGVFDAAGNQWRPTASMTVARSNHTATQLRDGTVLVAGGFLSLGGLHIIASAERYGTFSSGTITPVFTGSWFDPAQSGHGLHIEVLPDNQFLAAWFTFDPTGTQQAWFMGMGTYSGNTATVASVVQPVGGRWIPNFDPAAVVNRPWGTLTFTFTDCNHGRVDFISMVPGYGSGSMNLTRLTQPAGLTC